MPFARTNNINTHYQVQGEGEPLILIHDLGSSIADWEQQVPVLARRHKVIALSLRGFGKSDKPRGPTSIGQMASDVVALMNHLDMPRAHVLGHGLGGSVALQMAVDQSVRLSSMIVLNGMACCDLEYWRRYLLVVSRIGAGSGDGMSRIARYVARRLFPDPGQAALRQRLYERQRVNDRACYLAALRALAGWSVTARLQSVTVPVLMLAAENDYCPPEEKLASVRVLSDVRLEVVADSRHGTLWDQPAALNRLVLDFLVEPRITGSRLCPQTGGPSMDQTPAADVSDGAGDLPPN